MTRRPNGQADPFWNDARQRYELFVELAPGPDGKRRRRKVTGKTKTVVRERAKAVVAEVVRTGAAPDGTTTVQALMSAFLATLPGTVSDGTVEVYTRTNRLYIEPHLGKRRVRQLQPGDVEAWLRKLESNGLGVSTRRHARAVLRRAFGWGETRGYLNRNVVAVTPGPRGPQKDVQPLDVAEVKALLDAVADWRLGAAVVVMVTCGGLRRGEVLGLRWRDVDLDDGVLHVRQQLQRRQGRGLVLVELKTGKSRRTVAMPKRAVDALRAHRTAMASERMALGAGRPGPDDLVFTTPTGSPVEPRNFARELARHAEVAGLDGVHPHRLRHSNVAVLLDAGVPLEVVSETVGHSSVRTTKDVYGRLLDSGRARVAAAMDDALG